MSIQELLLCPSKSGSHQINKKSPLCLYCSHCPQSDLDDAINNQRAAEERANRLAAENARLADELRQEQENYKNAESLRKQLEIEIREITVRLEEAEAFAQREGKRQIARLQARVCWQIGNIIGNVVINKRVQKKLYLYLLDMSIEGKEQHKSNRDTI